MLVIRETVSEGCHIALMSVDLLQNNDVIGFEVFVQLLKSLCDQVIMGRRGTKQGGQVPGGDSYLLL